jgi:hypothetical protein
MKKRQPPACRSLAGIVVALLAACAAAAGKVAGREVHLTLNGGCLDTSIVYADARRVVPTCFLVGYVALPDHLAVAFGWVKNDGFRVWDAGTANGF